MNFQMQSPDENQFGQLIPRWRELTRRATGTETILGIGYDPVKFLDALWSHEVVTPFCSECGEGQADCECKWADGGSSSPTLPTSLEESPS